MAEFGLLDDVLDDASFFVEAQVRVLNLICVFMACEEDPELLLEDRFENNDADLGPATRASAAAWEALSRTCRSLDHPFRREAGPIGFALGFDSTAHRPSSHENV